MGSLLMLCIKLVTLNGKCSGFNMCTGNEYIQSNIYIYMYVLHSDDVEQIESVLKVNTKTESHFVRNFLLNQNVDNGIRMAIDECRPYYLNQHCMQCNDIRPCTIDTIEFLRLSPETLMISIHSIVLPCNR